MREGVPATALFSSEVSSWLKLVWPKASNVDAFLDSRGASYRDGPIGMYSFNGVRSHGAGSQLRWLVGDYQNSFSNGVIVASSPHVFLSQLLINEDLSSISNRLDVCEERDVEKHVALVNKGPW